MQQWTFHWLLTIRSSVDAINILWEDDGEDKDDSDWVTDNDSVMSDDGESGE
jgi:hypothetical protein